MMQGQQIYCKCCWYHLFMCLNCACQYSLWCCMPASVWQEAVTVVHAYRKIPCFRCLTFLKFLKLLMYAWYVNWHLFVYICGNLWLCSSLLIIFTAISQVTRTNILSRTICLHWHCTLDMPLSLMRLSLGDRLGGCGLGGAYTISKLLA